MPLIPQKVIIRKNGAFIARHIESSINADRAGLIFDEADAELVLGVDQCILAQRRQCAAGVAAYQRTRCPLCCSSRICPAATCAAGVAAYRRTRARCVTLS